MNRITKYLCFLLILAAPLCSSQSPTLVIEVFRAGARSPQKATYDVNPTNWEYYNELTPVGMRQQFILGRAISENYENNTELTTYNPATIYVYSTEQNQTLMSAYSQLYGMYIGQGPNISSSVPTNLTWPPYNQEILANVTASINYTSALPYNFMPIPIHSVDESDDYILEPYVTCPNMFEENEEHMNDETVEAVFAEMRETIDFVNSENIGTPVVNMSDAQLLGDTVICNLYNNFPPPANVSILNSTYTDLNFAFQWYNVYPYLATQKQRELYSAPLFWQINDYINGVRNGSSSLSFIFLVGHDVLLMTALSALGIVTPDCLRQNWEAIKNHNAINPNCTYPIFASQIIFEFYNDTQDPYLDIYYNSLPLDLCGQGARCSLAEFINITNAATNGWGISDFISICGIPTSFGSSYSFFANSGVLPIILGSVCILLLGILIILIKKKKERDNILLTQLANEQG